jgi:hypothetical protein
MLDAQISEVGMTLEAYALLDIKSAPVHSCLLTLRDVLSVQFQGSSGPRISDCLILEDDLPCVTYQKSE